MEIVVNKCYGGFGLSLEAIELYLKKQGKTCYWDERHKYTKMPFTTPTFEEDSYVSEYDIPRNDPLLVEVVKELGCRSDGDSARLVIITIPDDVDWMIQEYDGQEWVSEKHRTW